jgi:hypothetical protein
MPEEIISLLAAAVDFTIVRLPNIDIPSCKANPGPIPAPICEPTA